MPKSRITSSVALCTYNGSKYVEQQIRSILEQSVMPDEIVVCDDNSSDGTFDLLQQHASATSCRIRLFRNSQTLGSTRNFEKAIRHCTGEVVFLADQDDVWNENKIEAILAGFKDAADVGLIFSNADVVDADLRPTGRSLWESTKFDSRMRRMLRDGECFPAIVRYNPVTGATMAFRRSLAAMTYPFPEEWVHDAWIALHVSIRARVVALDHTLIKYRRHDTQQLGTNVDVAGRLASIRERDATYWRGEARKYRIARAHMHEVHGNAARKHMRTLDEKISHCEARSRILDRDSPHRGRAVANELMRGRYGQFSGGWRSIAKDILQVSSCIKRHD